MTIFEHAKRTMALAWPMMLAQGLSLMAFVIDTIMVGHAGGQELAYLSAGRSLLLVVSMVGIGLLNGIVVFTARADGAGNHKICGAIWKGGLVYAAILGAIGLLIVSVGGRHVLAKIGLGEDLVDGGGRFLAWIGLSLPGNLLFVASSFFLQGLSRPKPGMVAMMLSTPLLIFLNWLLVYGNWGAPQMGAAGAGLATAICQWSAAIGMFIYIRRMKAREHLGIAAPWVYAWREGRAVRRFGIPLGIAGGLEFMGMTSIIMIAGLLGEITISGIEVIFNMHLLAFIASFSIASATAVRVGNAVGRKDLGTIPRIAMVGVGLGILSMLPFILVYAVKPEPVFYVFTDNVAIHAMALTMVPFIVLTLPLDAVQFVLLHSLRAAGDQWVAAVMQVSAFLVIMVPAGWFAAFVLGLEGAGLASGFFVGALAAASMLGARFYVLAKSGFRTVRTTAGGH